MTDFCSIEKDDDLDYNFVSFFIINILVTKYPNRFFGYLLSASLSREGNGKI